MRNNLDSKAFTLVELLTVVVLLGVIMMLAIPSLRNLTYNNSEQQYNYHVKFVEEATKLYARNHKSELEKDKTSTCFNIPYQALLEEDLIEEEEISCEGNVILEKRSREGYNHKYYLTCRDSSGKVVHESEPIPLNWQLIIVYIKMVKVNRFLIQRENGQNIFMGNTILVVHIIMQ